jgi:membrane protein
LKLKNPFKKIIIPGFEGLSLHEVSLFFYRGITKGAVTTRASSLAFNFFLAFFPSIIVIFTLIPFVPITGFQEQLFMLIMEVLPPSTFGATKSIVNDIINNERGGLLSFTFILALYFCTNGVNAMITGFNSTYHHQDNRSWVQLKLLSFSLTGVLAIFLVLTIAFQIASEGFLSYLVSEEYIGQFLAEIIFSSKGFILVIGLFLSISSIYYYAPADKSRWKFLSPGSILCTFLSVFTSIIFSYYVTNFAQYNQLYGSIGTLLVILLWMYFNSIILLIGFELNASILSAKESQSKKLSSKMKK